ncbi:MAG: hypothetical protein RR519_04425 [Victivallaceae bacterium]
MTQSASTNSRYGPDLHSPLILNNETIEEITSDKKTNDPSRVAAFFKKILPLNANGTLNTSKAVITALVCFIILGLLAGIIAGAVTGSPFIGLGIATIVLSVSCVGLLTQYFVDKKKKPSQIQSEPDNRSSRSPGSRPRTTREASLERLLTRTEGLADSAADFSKGARLLKEKAKQESETGSLVDKFKTFFNFNRENT